MMLMWRETRPWSCRLSSGVNRWKSLWLAGLVFVFGIAGSAGSPRAEDLDPGKVMSQVERRVVTPAAHLKAGSFHRWMFGRDYRDLWTTPMEVEVLDLGKVAGGLTPRFRVGGMQTPGLAMRGADGRDYTFRSIVKNLTEVLPAELRATLAGRLVQDQLAGAHPAGPLMVPTLAEAVGVLHLTPRLVVMPDDPSLGQFREDFAGRVGTLEEYPGAVSETNPGFHGATEIISTSKLWKRLLDGGNERVDARAFLRARILDLFLGDWDRHRKQWRWAKFPDRVGWQPIPEDRDQAFANYEGALMFLVRFYQPKLLVFRDHYPNIEGPTTNGWQVDRLLLTSLEKSDWDDLAQEVERRLTDDVIESAVRRMPKELYEKNGTGLAQLLKKRRAGLFEVVDRFYHHLAAEVDVHCTDQNDRAEIRSLGDGGFELSVARAEGGEFIRKVYFRRTFHYPETREVRIYLHGGADEFVAEGETKIRIFVVGGEGDDEIRVTEGSEIRFFDSQGSNLVAGKGKVRVGPEPYENPLPDPTQPWAFPRDWGQRRQPLLWIGFSPDGGPVLGGGATWTNYGFRKNPYAFRHVVRAGFAFGVMRSAGSYRGEYRRRNSRIFSTLEAGWSGFDNLNFYGFGNETSREMPDEFYELEKRTIRVVPEIHYEAKKWFDLFVGPELQISFLDIDAGTLLGGTLPYGAKERFGQLGLRGGFKLASGNPGDVRGLRSQLEAQGVWVPGLWDVRSSYGSVGARWATRVDFSSRAGMGIRVSGEKVLGNFPYHGAAYLGGSETLRGYLLNRFAGEASVSGSLELSFLVGRFTFLVPGQWGVMALGDLGRVFLDGESSKEWHPAVGGGFFVNVLEQSARFGLSVVQTDEGTSFYIASGTTF